MLASFGAAFVKGDPRTTGVYDHDFRDARSVHAAVTQRADQPLAPQLAALLAAQQNELAHSAERSRNLDALVQSQGTGVVVTGQQVGLFLGPLYTVYKAATAIVAARALSAQTGRMAVPLFWLQTEDHDYEEIRSCTIPSPDPIDPPLVLSLPPSCPDTQRMSVAYRLLDGEIDAMLSAIDSHLHSLPFAAECLLLLRRHYVAGRSLSQAFARLLSEIFAEEGLLFLDPRQPGQTVVPTLSAPLYRRCLSDHEAISTALVQRQRELTERGFASQIPVRPQTSLLFYYPDGERGPRHRLERKPRADALMEQSSDRWSIPDRDRSFPQTDLLTQIDTNPLLFGTSALLRPLVQDTLLPTVAYVGGPAELSYLAQLAPVYKQFGIAQPLWMPRARFRILEEKDRSTLAKLGLRAASVEGPNDQLLEQLARRHSDLPSPQALSDRVLSQLLSPLAEVEAIDPALHDAVARARRAMEKTAQKLSQRYAQRLRERDEVTAQRVARLQASLYPLSAPQERIFSLPYYLAKYGLPAWKQKLFASLSTDSVCSLDQSVRDIEL